MGKLIERELTDEDLAVYAAFQAADQVAVEAAHEYADRIDGMIAARSGQCPCCYGCEEAPATESYFSREEDRWVLVCFERYLDASPALRAS